jgi:hypothetical protein
MKITHCFRSATKGAFVKRYTSMNMAEAYVDVFHWLFLNNKQFYHNTLFATHINEWLHFEALLQWRYLSELCVTSYESTGKSKRTSPKKNSLTLLPARK